MKQHKQKMIAKRLLVAMLSVMMAVTFIPASLFVFAGETDEADEVQNEVVQEEVQTEDADQNQEAAETETEATEENEEAQSEEIADEDADSEADEAEKPGTLLLTKTIDGDITAQEAEKALKFEIRNDEGKWLEKTGALSDAEVMFTLGDFTKDNGKYALEIETEELGDYTVTETVPDFKDKDVTVTYSVDGGESKIGSKADVSIKADDITEVDSTTDVTVRAAEDGNVVPMPDGVIRIPFTKNWDDNNNAAGDRPESIEVTLTYTQGAGGKSTSVTRTVTGGMTDDTWTYTFELVDTEADPLFYGDDLTPVTFTIDEEVPAGYTKTDYDNPEISMVATYDETNRHEPCNYLEIPISISTYPKSWVAIKKGGSYYIWTPEVLSPLEQRIIHNQAITINGFHSEATKFETFLTGFGQDSVSGVGFYVDEASSTIIFEKQSKWALIGWGEYTRSVDSNNCYITNSKIPPGSLKLEKTVSGAPSSAAEKEYKISVKASDGRFVQADGSLDTSEYFFTVKDGDTVEINNVPVGTYTVTEDKTDAQIDGYALTVTGEGSVTIESEQTASKTITNTYTHDLGDLTVKKVVSEVPASATGKEYKFSVSTTVDGKTLYVQADKSLGETEYFFTVEGGSSMTIDGIPTGDYTVTEDTASAAIDGYTLTASGGGAVTVTKNSEATSTLTNEYTQDFGKLNVTKIVTGGADLPADTKFKFSVQDSNGNYVQSEDGTIGPDEHFFEVAKGETVSISNLPIGTYTVTEDTEDPAIQIEGYTLDVTGGGEVTITKDNTTDSVITNNYIKDIGDLKVTKTVSGAPSSESEKEFKFSVSTTVGGGTLYVQADKSLSAEEYFFTVTAEEPVWITEIPAGTYTVTEDTEAAEIDGYTLTATGGGSVEVPKDDMGESELVNEYTRDTGSLTVEKIVSEVPASATGKEYKFSISTTVDGKTLYVQEDKSLGEAEYFFTVEGGSSVTIEGIPTGEYTVTEDTDDAAIEGYTLTAEGGGSVTIEKEGEAKSTLTNTYEETPPGPPAPPDDPDNPDDPDEESEESDEPDTGDNGFSSMMNALLLSAAALALLLFRRNRRDSLE